MLSAWNWYNIMSIIPPFKEKGSQNEHVHPIMYEEHSIYIFVYTYIIPTFTKIPFFLLTLLY